MNRELVDKLRLDAGIARLTAEWDQALICIGKDGKVIDPLDGLENFAKLIVEECIFDCVRCTYRHGDSEHNRALMMAVDEIKKHFGVE